METTTEFQQQSINATDDLDYSLEHSNLNQEHHQTECNREKIQRGSTSIFIIEANQKCVDGVRNGIYKKDDNESSEMTSNNDDVNPCSRTFKRSTKDESVEDETVIVIKKRGNKVFIEL